MRIAICDDEQSFLVQLKSLLTDCCNASGKLTIEEFAIHGYEVNAFRYILKGQPEQIMEHEDENCRTLIEAYRRSRRSRRINK